MIGRVTGESKIYLDYSKLLTKETLQKATLVALSILLMGGGIAVGMHAHLFPTLASGILTGAFIGTAGLMFSASLLAFCQPSKETVLKTSLVVISLLFIGAGTVLGMNPSLFPSTASCILVGTILGAAGLIVDVALLNSCRYSQSKGISPQPRRVNFEPSVQPNISHQRNRIDDIAEEHPYISERYYVTVVGEGTDAISQLSEAFRTRFCEDQSFSTLITELREQCPNVSAMIAVHDRNTRQLHVDTIAGHFNVNRCAVIDMDDEFESSSNIHTLSIDHFDGMLLSFKGKAFNIECEDYAERTQSAVRSLQRSLRLSRSEVTSFFSQPTTDTFLLSPSVSRISETYEDASFKFTLSARKELASFGFCCIPNQLTFLGEHNEYAFAYLGEGAIGQEMIGNLIQGQSLYESANALTQLHPNVSELFAVYISDTEEWEYVVIGQTGIEYRQALCLTEAAASDSGSFDGDVMILDSNGQALFLPKDSTSISEGPLIANTPYFYQANHSLTCIGDLEVGNAYLEALRNGGQTEDLFSQFNYNKNALLLFFDYEEMRGQYLTFGTSFVEEHSAVCLTQSGTERYGKITGDSGFVKDQVQVWVPGNLNDLDESFMSLDVSQLDEISSMRLSELEE